MAAKRAEIRSVSRMVLLPDEILAIKGRCAAAYEHAKLTKTAIPIMRSLRAGGIITAINMPKIATLRALTILAGKAVPVMIPIEVPRAHIGTAALHAPKP